MEHWGVQPDVMTTAKGMTSGYAPMGGVIVREALMAPKEPRVPDFGNIHTYSYHPVSVAVASAVLDILEREKLVERCAKRWGGYSTSGWSRCVRTGSSGTSAGWASSRASSWCATGRRASRLKRRPEGGGGGAGGCEAPRGGAVFGFGDGRREFVGDHVMIAPPFIVSEARAGEIVGVLSEALDEVAAERPGA
jgi:adenosylmethionine-8-amino-7-oxononanoate aminotransferase